MSIEHDFVPPPPPSPKNMDALSEIAYSDDEYDKGYTSPVSSTVPSPIMSALLPSKAPDTLRSVTPVLFRMADMSMGSASYTADHMDDSFRDFMSPDDALLQPKQRVFRSARDALIGDQQRESFAAVLAREDLSGPEMQIRLRDFLSARDALASLTDAPASFASVLQSVLPDTPDTQPQPPVAFKFAIGDRVVSKNETYDAMSAGIVTATAVGKENLPTYTVLFLDENTNVAVAEHHMFKMSSGIGDINPTPSIMQPLYQHLNKRVAQKSFIFI